MEYCFWNNSIVKFKNTFPVPLPQTTKDCRSVSEEAEVRWEVISDFKTDVEPMLLD